MTENFAETPALSSVNYPEDHSIEVVPPTRPERFAKKKIPHCIETRFEPILNDIPASFSNRYFIGDSCE